jgi:two-component sensor histidine kinase/DNA-binding response OmpR family regulator
MPSVMIAEDDLFMADMLEEALAANGYDVCGIARTVERAVELAERYKPDLAVLDIRLADGGLGTDIPARLKSQGHMGVLYASGQVGQMSLTMADGDALIVKPYRSEDVIRALRIVEQIISSRNASRYFPKGFSVLKSGVGGDPAASSLDANLAEQSQRLRRQQSELARFSAFAVVCRDLDRVLAEATRVCAECMGAPYCAVYRYRPEENDLIVAAGFGWDHGIIGRDSSRADGSTPHGRAFITGEPVICNDLSADSNLVRPRMYATHGIVTTLNVLIVSDYQPLGVTHGVLENLPYGVLAIGSTAQRSYDHHDIEFMSSIANITASAVDTMKRDAALRVAADRLQDVIDDQGRINESRNLVLDEKIRLAGEKMLLVEEVQHRVRNNLQLVYAMLGKQLESTTDPAAISGLSAISRRVMTLVQLYDHVMGTGLSRTIDFDTYLTALCAKHESLESAQHSKIKLTCRTEPVTLDLDSATTLGLVVSQLIANSYGRAFPEDTGTISVSLHKGTPVDDATITLADDSVADAAPDDGEQHDADMVKRLMKEAGGSATLRLDHGVEWTLKFPVRRVLDAPAEQAPAVATPLPPTQAR